MNLIRRPQTPEEDIAATEIQRETVRVRLEQAGSDYGAAVAERREVLIGDAIHDAVAVRDAESAVRAADLARGGLADALQVIDARLAEMRNKVAVEADRLERDRIAIEIEDRADRMANAAVAVDKIAERLAPVLAEAQRLAKEFSLPQPFGSAPDLAGGAGRLAGTLPTTDSDIAFQVARCAYGVVHGRVEELRALATKIRAGDAPAILPALPEPPPPARVPETIVRCTLCRPISYATRRGNVSTLSGEIDLPLHVAEAAKAKGYGFDPGTRDAAAITHALKRLGSGAALMRGNGGQWVQDFGPAGEDGRPEGLDMWVWLDVEPAA